MAKVDNSTKIKELLEIVKDKVDSMTIIQTGQSASIRLMRDQLSVVNKKVDGITERLDGVTERLDDPKAGLKEINRKLNAVWEQTSDLTEDSGVTKENIKRLDKRVSLLEKNSGIKTAPEHMLADAA